MFRYSLSTDNIHAHCAFIQVTQRSHLWRSILLSRRSICAHHPAACSTAFRHVSTPGMPGSYLSAGRLPSKRRRPGIRCRGRSVRTQPQILPVSAAICFLQECICIIHQCTFDRRTADIKHCIFHCFPPDTRIIASGKHLLHIYSWHIMCHSESFSDDQYTVIPFYCRKSTQAIQANTDEKNTITASSAVNHNTVAVLLC